MTTGLNDILKDLGRPLKRDEEWAVFVVRKLVREVISKWEAQKRELEFERAEYIKEAERIGMKIYAIQLQAALDDQNDNDNMDNQGVSADG